MLFSGDHVMHGSTVVIAPPDGDMARYLASLRRVLDLDPPLATIAPGHGALIVDPAAALVEIIEHRHARERMVADALGAAGRATVDELVPRRLRGRARRAAPGRPSVAVGPPAHARRRRRGPW